MTSVSNVTQSTRGYNINQKGGTHSKPLSNIVCILWNLCLKKDISIQADQAHSEDVEHTSGVQSRVFQDSCDWVLLRQVYSSKMRKMDVDPFAAQHSHQIKNY